MGVGRTSAIALQGLQAALVDVEADVAQGLPAMVLIGLPDAALAEARDRVRAAAGNSGCGIVGHKLTINLSPAALPKHGSGFDLAIALASLAALGTVSRESVASVVHLGELGLDGRLRPTAGVLPAVLGAARAGASTVMVPTGNQGEAGLVPGIRVIPATSLRDAAIWHGAELEPVPTEPIQQQAPAGTGVPALDLAEIVGNADAITALTVAAAGGHHSFLLGPPGAGKTMLAERLPGILPDLDVDSALEATSVRSLSGQPIGDRLLTRPPFEAPHHTATAASLIGGGSGRIRPGAAVRACHGVLFLDEAPEFPGAVLDVLRQPLESGEITIHRVGASARFPARFQLVLAANPCPCGHYGDADAECLCSPTLRRRYMSRLSGPLMDRIDIRLGVRRITAAQLRLPDQSATTTAQARERVERARAAAAERLADTPWRLNAHVPGTWLRHHSPGRAATAPLERALERGGITMRGYDRALRLAWTLADVEGADSPTLEHVGAALYLRRGVPA